MDRPVCMKPVRQNRLHTLKSLLLAFALLAGGAGPVQADFITFAGDVDRGVQAQAMINNGTPVVDSIMPPQFVGLFSQTATATATGTGMYAGDSVSSMASQISNVPLTGNTASVSGSASFSSTISNGSSGSVYNLPPTNNNLVISGFSFVFEILTPQVYTATITLSSSTSGNAGLASNTIAELVSYSTPQPPLPGFSVGAPESNLTLTGLLLPGDYQLDVYSEVFNQAPLTTNEFVNSSFSVIFQVSPTPEPGSLVLLVLGATGLAGYRWLRKAAYS